MRPSDACMCGNLIITSSENCLVPRRCKAIIWTNVEIMLIRAPGTNFNEILSEIETFLFKKMHLKTSSGKWRPFGLGLNVLSMSMYRVQYDSDHNYDCIQSTPRNIYAVLAVYRFYLNLTGWFRRCWIIDLTEQIKRFLSIPPYSIHNKNTGASDSRWITKS